MAYLLIIGVAVWFWLGDPPRTVAGWFWEHEAAPWERVDAFYYPSRLDMTKHQQVDDVGSVETCRDAVYAIAAGHGDPDIQRGDYECGVGPRYYAPWGMNIYRITVR